MTYKTRHARSGLTAIAAVLALSSTSLSAQEANPPPDPVTETPTETSPAADPLAPEPTASEPAPAAEAAPVATPTRSSTPARARKAATNRAPSAPARSAAPAARPATNEAAPVPVEAAPLPAAPLAEPVATPVAPPAEQVATTDNSMADDALPIAGAAGLGLLALGGIGLAVGRRRRRREEREHQRANQLYLEQHPEPVTPPPADEPAFFRGGQQITQSALPEAEVITDVPRTKLPSNFDLSRFGPHVRAAYMGPTPDNPSLSLRHRLRRASALDQRARLEAEKQVEQPALRPAAEKKPMWNADNDGFMLRRAERRQPSQPSFQH